MEESSESQQIADPPPLASGVPSQSPKLSLRPMYMTLLLVAGIVLGVGGVFGYQEFVSGPTVTTYEECIRAKGSRVQESFPPTCVTRDGKRFTQPTVDDEINPIYTDPLSCNTDRDCTIGIQTNGCCVCPEPINKTEIGKDGWESYMPGKNYSKQSVCKSFIACQPCETPSTPICRDNQCVFDTGVTVPSPSNQGFTCPKSEWVDCMPGPLEGKTTGIKLECTPEFLSWAKINCPDFQDAVY